MYVYVFIHTTFTSISPSAGEGMGVSITETVDKEFSRICMRNNNFLIHIFSLLFMIFSSIWCWSMMLIHDVDDIENLGLD